MRILWAIYPSAFVIYCGFSTKPVFWYSQSIIKWIKWLGWWSASSSEVDLRELQRLGFFGWTVKQTELGFGHQSSWSCATKPRVVTPWISLDFTMKQTVFIASNSDGSWCNNVHRLFFFHRWIFKLTCKTWNITVSSVNNSFIVNVVGFYQVVFFNRIFVEFLGRRW